MRKEREVMCSYELAFRSRPRREPRQDGIMEDKEGGSVCSIDTSGRGSRKGMSS